MGLKRQIDMERQEAEAHFLQDWKRRIDDGSYQAEVGNELESDADYERAYRQQEDHVEHISSMRKDNGIKEVETSVASDRARHATGMLQLLLACRNFSV